ncbi:hypothetical protein P171DRAFT_195316 [Karstenula rhodostoma CBS 690.94]|uniref:Uncharacterized protein n=1 Tax=Karstenula rhodostoma CBS 690.94 TaxID=1392251 RepID=A0A9P4UHS0_9PLEO|nr:hypothetical protein P171DRAFT_195316 [Karstenula rhodostoma CBS 690.94]
MDPPAVNAPSSPQTPLNNTNFVPVSPKSVAPPRRSSPAHDDATEIEAGAHGHSAESIETLSRSFLVKVQQVFGQHSDEWKTISRALLQFKHRSMSKKEAHYIMTQVLSSNDMLSHDLFDILNHNDAHWAPEDWSRPINPPGSLQTLNPTSPDFLQPSHQPNFPRLPSMFQALGGESSASRPHMISPTILQSPSTPYAAHRMTPTPYHGGQGQLGSLAATFEDYSGYGGQQEQFTPHSQSLPISWTPNSFVPNSLSSPGHLMPNPTPLSQHHVPSSWHQDPTLAPPRDVRRELGMNPNEQTYSRLDNPNEPLSSAAYTAEAYQQYPQQYQWQNGHYIGGWANDNLWQHEHEHITPEHRSSHVSPSLRNQAVPQLAPGQLSSDASPTTIATPATSVMNVPRLFQNELNKVQAEYAEGEQNINNDARSESYEDIPTSNDGSRAGLSGERQARLSVARSTPKPEGGFIHAICGKGFHSRSAVKKHHWGPKAGDLTTTRGCWAKNKRPDVAWDAHPSCRTGSTRLNTNNRQSIATEDDDSVSTSPELNAAPPPAMVSRRSAVQQFNNTPVHGLDTLVSAASFAERIDAPRPQDGRNDSVVAQLDAQAAIAQRNRRTLPPWSTQTGFGTALTGRSPYIQMQPPAARLGTTHSPSGLIPTNMMLPSQHVDGFTLPEDQTSHAQATQEEDVQPKVDSNVNKKRQRATSNKASAPKREKQQPESRSSSPERKKAKVQK